jgi:23S rRNA pseudouridine1911/1915/1917 synthase
MDRQKAAPQDVQGRRLSATVPHACSGQRLDRVLALLFADYSRSRLQRWVREGRVRVDGEACDDTRARLDGGESVQLVPAPEPVQGWPGQPMELSVLHRDPHLMIVDKPAGVVVHPGAGNPDHTLVNALVHLQPSLAQLPRAGLVHRLDKNTSGLMVVARTLEAQTRLTRLIASRQVHRGYEAIVHGSAPPKGRVDAPVGRHRTQRTRMSVRDGGRHAVTHYRRLRAFRAHTQLSLDLETGRTHQIRVHLRHIGHPIVGDREYGGVRAPPGALGEDAAKVVTSFTRQALHARRLAFVHPMTGREVAFCSPLPADMAALVDALDRDLSS